ncbi:hypothetical protein [Echinicola sediminis]
MEVDEKELELLWLADKIIDDIDQEPQGLKALNFVQGELVK